MPDACLGLWPTERCEWSTWDIWHSSDIVEHAIYLGLALMLGYTVFVVIRFFRRYYLVRREFPNFKASGLPNIHRVKSNLFADFSPAVGMLRGIASAAPFLGLAGTSYSVLAALSSGYIGTPGGFIALLSARISGALITTVFGILVAIPATLSHDLLRSRMEALSEQLSPRRNKIDLGSFHFAQTLSLRKPFSKSPTLAVIAAPALACVVMAYMTFRLYEEPIGLSVGLLPLSVEEGTDHLAPQLFISILSRDNARPLIRVNSDEIPYDSLFEIAGQKVRGGQAPLVFVEADSSVPWAYVVDIVDKMKKLPCRVVLLTTTPTADARDGQSHRRRIPIALLDGVR